MNASSPPAPEQVWTGEDLARDPHTRADKAERVRAMFGAIARSYDLNNRVHSLWRDQAWRRFAVQRAAVKPGDVVLDVACGTGDLAEMFARAGAHRVIGVDLTPEMLAVARERLERGARANGQAWAERITYIQGDAQALPMDDQSVDVVSIAFGIRNVLDPARAVREFRRVLRPGGRLVVLEFAEPRRRLVRWFHDLYCRRIMPRTATWLSGDKTGAYRYLPRSVETFLSREQMVRMLASAGFARVASFELSMGICVCYHGIVSTS